MAFFVGSQMMNLVNTKETDALITSEFVQAVEQDRVKNVVYDAGDYTVLIVVTCRYGGSTASDAYNAAIEALDAKTESLLGPGSAQVETTTELSEQTLGTERKYTFSHMSVRTPLCSSLSAHPDIQYQVKLPDGFMDALLSLLPMLFACGPYDFLLRSDEQGQ